MRWQFTAILFAVFALAVSLISAPSLYSPQVTLAQADQPVPAPLLTPDEKKAAAEKQKAEMIARGDYLTHSVAMCVICHSPKDEHGNPIRERQFQGGVIPARPAAEGMTSWASNAPALGPLAGGTGDEVAHLLQTGIWLPTGKSPRPPMPPFRMNAEDAQAIVAYLKSLK